jgi:Ni/Co efflux regulator RcnB
VSGAVQARLKPGGLFPSSQVETFDREGEITMKRFATAAVAALIATGSLGLAATSASAQNYDRGPARYEQSHDRREHRQNARDDRREFRQDQRAYARYQRAERRYNAARWQQPRGHSYRTYSYGQRLPSAYNAYVVNDYSRYGLRAPPRGYHYVRNGNDVVLAAVAGGLITAVIAGLFN